LAGLGKALVALGGASYEQQVEYVAIVAALAMFAAGCSSDRVTDHKPVVGQLLAGGGRFADQDPSGGRTDTSGPTLPEPWPYQGPMVLFASDIDCRHEPIQRIIADSVAWRLWWDSAWACMPQFPPDTAWPWPDSMGGGMMPPDSVVGDTTFQGDSTCWPLPYVDFDSSVVIVIALEEDSSWGRMLWLDEVASSGSGTEIRYTVARFAGDCATILMGMALMAPSSPTVAVQVPKPVDPPIDWARHDTIWSCIWEPDPNAPVTTYYTDTPCPLGPNQQVITDSASYRGFIEAAAACDSARFWTFFVDSGYGGWAQPMFGLEVDFSTHAVIVLRAGAQTRWGGGIWLNRFESAGGTTLIGYMVMEPDSDCPPVEELPEVNPTVAIRVPLPLGPVITWNRTTETIGCLWPDSSGGGIPGDSLR
jgi:hypothetical protein